MDIADFVKDRLDEDEATARKAIDGTRFYKDSLCRASGEWAVGVGLVEDLAYGCVVIYEYENRDGLLDHIARHDPARALREAAAKRRVLERHRPRGGNLGWQAPACAGCGTEGYCDDPVTEKMSDCPELRDMAAVWEDHPDYRGEWAPWAP